ncbi:hypothetical protein [Pseudomonas sp. WS 5414]|uniref:hypothetical protein n=1 Tax=Pseudomonas sp. WS 5414 TaxID=2717478 RepID=UPI001475C80B|nr:hypothetical protein [Pseudomonas sp. WS 5414]NMY71852.1 hypothetical protein [Pseudomonas sp. WS 5414]
MALRDCAKVLLESGRLSIMLMILMTYVPLISLALPNWLHWLSVAAAAGCERLRSRRRS